MAFISFEQSTTALSDQLRVEYREALPFAAVVALTRTAIKSRDLMKDHMKKAFRHPTPYALNAVRAVPATKATLSSAVLLREFGKGTKASQFLGPEVEGGGRGQKRFEKALSLIGVLAPGGYAVPGAGAALNSYGEQSRGQIVKILSVLGALGEQGYTANRKKKWGKKSRQGQIFAVRASHTSGGLKPGIYKRGPGNAVIPLVAFLKSKPNYRVRLPFDQLVENDANKIFPTELEAALHQYGDKK